MTAQRGFTLLELMVVLVIMGLAASFSVAWLAGSGPQQAQEQLQQLESDWRLAADMAMGEQQIIGWQVTAQGYRFVTWSVIPDQPGQGHWIPLETRHLPQRHWHQPVDLKRTPAMSTTQGTFERQNNGLSMAPWLIWWPNGEVLSATLRLRIQPIDTAPWVRQWRIDGLGVHRQDIQS